MVVATDTRVVDPVVLSQVHAGSNVTQKEVALATKVGRVVVSGYREGVRVCACQCARVSG